jgi:hypothetical protein
MAHFAQVNDENIVIQVLVTDNDYPNEGYDWLLDTFGGKWVQTSYNARIRKNYAGVGMIYDNSRDAFIAEQPYASWTLDEETCQWEAPKAYPNDGVMYMWNEELTDWQAIVND